MISAQTYAFLIVASSLTIVACAGDSDVERPPPNIIMILGDDHGYEYFGFMGSNMVKTPHLDEMAAEGVLFPNGHVTATVCPPSLRTLLTGLYPMQYDHLAGQISDIPAGQSSITHFNTLPKMLAHVGYRSFEGGKYWALG